MVDIWIIIEHCQFGRLMWTMLEEQELTVKQKLSLMIQAGRAVCNLHEQPVSVVHRSITPVSLLVSGTPNVPVIKLARFNCATTVDKDDFPFSMQSDVGSVCFAAPEQTRRGDTEFTQLKYDISVDVYALGINCYMLLEAVRGSLMPLPKGEYINIPWWLFMSFICIFCIFHICYIILKWIQLKVIHVSEVNYILYVFIEEYHTDCSDISQRDEEGKLWLVDPLSYFGHRNSPIFCKM